MDNSGTGFAHSPTENITWQIREVNFKVHAKVRIGNNSSCPFRTCEERYELTPGAFDA